MSNWRKISVSMAGLAVLVTTAACGNANAGNDDPYADPAALSEEDSGYGYDYGDEGGEQAQGAEGAEGAVQLAAAGELATYDSGELGELVKDGEGFTLYRFDEDSADPPASNCAGDCAVNWPPVSADAAAGTGIDPGLLGTVRRADGSEQLTIAGWPAYRYAGDTGPEQTAGQGAGGSWWAIAADGARASGQGGAEGAGEAAGDLPGLSVFEHPEYGEILRDGQGRTLYRFADDSAWPMESLCTGDCLDNWPAAGPPADPADVAGVDAELLDVFNRPDGIQQLVIDCWPLYRYAGDAEPGDVNGQGVGGKWYVVSPEGKMIKS
ncbi:SCO0930 family lipoprotein [Streptomyces aidingensis]|uniref:Predicted lipoprotein with conserved Yx(FWY)xxD motif n=1 Tax=Streptomyces aidingensis TaxID=910347 RepID=A0A1I1HD14_9ACTN|nr:SCO0930 family lipoprotein [Streptomyces aidingensis]SFC21595.1 Predicted lipoprotein with conserved Yx(FWY)xxD motif [Streptomyces aidingensis]